MKFFTISSYWDPASFFSLSDISLSSKNLISCGYLPTFLVIILSGAGAEGDGDATESFLELRQCLEASP
ncbi:hypothetical protein DDI74_18715 [Chryseobacterium gleum]|nr:hypothetical protein DDI74_18715 [Chryseobacterium gleum]